MSTFGTPAPARAQSSLAAMWSSPFGAPGGGFFSTPAPAAAQTSSGRIVNSKHSTGGNGLMQKLSCQGLDAVFKVLRQQTEAISRLATVLKMDLRDVDIILTENTEMIVIHIDNDNRKYHGNRSMVGFTKKFHSGF